MTPEQDKELNGMADEIYKAATDGFISAARIKGKLIKALRLGQTDESVDWPPIETAPKDRTMFLAFRFCPEQTPIMRMVFWNHETAQFENWPNEFGPPTHWMPPVVQLDQKVNRLDQFFKSPEK